jgi:putative hydrolase of the HAD superfamily
MSKVNLIFDFDNTLAYRDGMWTATIYEILQENGYDKIKKKRN